MCSTPAVPFSPVTGPARVALSSVPTIHLTRPWCWPCGLVCVVGGGGGAVEQVPKLVSLLAESYNPHVRYGACLAIGIACARTGSAEALRVVEPMLADISDFVRQVSRPHSHHDSTPHVLRV